MVREAANASLDGRQVNALEGYRAADRANAVRIVSVNIGEVNLQVSGSSGGVGVWHSGTGIGGAGDDVLHG